MHNRIKAVRENAGLNQADFAKAVGLNRSTVSLMESGKVNPGNRTIRDICKIFGINEDWMRTGKGRMKPAPEDLMVIDPDSTIKLLGREYNLTPEAEELIRQFVKLPPDGQSAVVGYVSNVAEGLMSISESRSDSVVALSTAESEREARRSALHSALDSELDSEEEALLETSSASMLA